jgi:hypothetical protein
MRENKIYFEDDPLWYKDAIIYQLHVKTFFDGTTTAWEIFKVWLRSWTIWKISA